MKISITNVLFILNQFNILLQNDNFEVKLLKD